MAIPEERISTYLDNAVKLNLSWLNEVAKGATSQRLHEINRDSKLVKVIVKGLVYQHRKNMLESME